MVQPACDEEATRVETLVRVWVVLWSGLATGCQRWFRLGPLVPRGPAQPASGRRVAHELLLAAELASLERIRSRAIMPPRIANRWSGEVPAG